MPDITLTAGQIVVLQTGAKGASLNITTKTSKVKEFPELGTAASGTNASNFKAITLSANANKTVTLMANTRYLLKADAAAITYNLS